MSSAATLALICACGQVEPASPDAGLDAPPPPSDLLIDDLEDGDGTILARGRRVGGWFMSHDNSAGGVQTPAPFAPTVGGTKGSAYCAGTTGRGFADWGASLEVDLNRQPAGLMPYDIGAHTGIQFEARGNIAVHAGVVTLGTLNVNGGGACTPAPDAPCNDYHGRRITLGPEWVTFTLPFADLTQQGWGKPAAFDPATAVRVRFGIGKNLDFNFCIDDLRFY